MNIKEVLKQHLITILCVIAILALAFPLVSISSDYGGTSSITGFAAIEHSFFALLLIILPVILAASNYLKPLEPFKRILSLGVPVFCLLLLILVFFSCKSVLSGGADAAAAFGVDIDVKVGLCTIIAALSYIALGVVGFKNGKGNISMPTGVTVPNINASSILENVQEKAVQAAERVKTAASDMAANHSSESVSTPTKRSVSVNRTNEILGLIERLSAMKEAGVLTEEEFSQKKQSLLEEI